MRFSNYEAKANDIISTDKMQDDATVVVGLLLTYLKRYRKNIDFKYIYC